MAVYLVPNSRKSLLHVGGSVRSFYHGVDFRANNAGLGPVTIPYACAGWEKERRGKGVGLAGCVSLQCVRAIKFRLSFVHMFSKMHYMCAVVMQEY